MCLFVMFLAFSELVLWRCYGGCPSRPVIISQLCVCYECVSVSMCVRRVRVSLEPSGCQSSASSLSPKPPKRVAGSSSLSVNISH